MATSDGSAKDEKICTEHSPGVLLLADIVPSLLMSLVCPFLPLYKQWVELHLNNFILCSLNVSSIHTEPVCFLILSSFFDLLLINKNILFEFVFDTVFAWLWLFCCKWPVSCWLHSHSHNSKRFWVSFVHRWRWVWAKWRYCPHRPITTSEWKSIRRKSIIIIIIAPKICCGHS